MRKGVARESIATAMAFSKSGFQILLYTDTSTGSAQVSRIARIFSFFTESSVMSVRSVYRN